MFFDLFSWFSINRKFQSTKAVRQRSGGRDDGSKRNYDGERMGKETNSWRCPGWLPEGEGESPLKVHSTSTSVQERDVERASPPQWLRCRPHGMEEQTEEVRTSTPSLLRDCSGSGNRKRKGWMVGVAEKGRARCRGVARCDYIVSSAYYLSCQPLPPRSVFANPLRARRNQ